MRTHTQATINGNWFGVWCVRRPPSHLNKKKRNETEMCAFFSSIMPIAICSNSAIECEWMNHIIESATELLAHRMQICNLWVFVKQWMDSVFFFTLLRWLFAFIRASLLVSISVISCVLNSWTFYSRGDFRIFLLQVNEQQTHASAPATDNNDCWSQGWKPHSIRYANIFIIIFRSEKSNVQIGWISLVDLFASLENQ